MTSARDVPAAGRPRRVALALGSGGARGYAHVGAVEVLQERGFEVVGIAGTSMGALVGGLSAAGRLSEFVAWARGLSQLDVVRLLAPTPRTTGAARVERVLAVLHELAGDVRIEDLPVPFTAVATDLHARREVWFQRGPLDLAVRASIAIPGVVAPAVVDGRLLVDGGLLDPVPIAPLASVPADVRIAVDLGGGRGEGAVQGAEATAEGPRSRLGRFDVMTLSLEAMQTVLTRYRLAGLPPDVLVTVPKDACRSLDFHRAAEVIELGRTLTAQALDREGLTARVPAPGQTTSSERLDSPIQ